MAVKVKAVTATAGVLAVSVAIGAQTPVTHRFTPQRFYNTFSFAHPPALRIRPGDRVVTKTIDAAGVDWNGKQVGQGPNPQTGPFYIEGAEPGDALVVTIERIETNRATGYSASLLAPYAVDPASIAARAEREPRRVNWIIDKARGTTRTDEDGTYVLPNLPTGPYRLDLDVRVSSLSMLATRHPAFTSGNLWASFLDTGRTCTWSSELQSSSEHSS